MTTAFHHTTPELLLDEQRRSTEQRMAQNLLVRHARAHRAAHQLAHGTAQPTFTRLGALHRRLPLLASLRLRRSDTTGPARPSRRVAPVR